MLRPFIVLLVCLAGAAGCSKPKSEVVPVTGRITYGGGDWPAAGTLFFKPKREPGRPTVRPGMASFGPDGHFVVKTGEREGLAPGTYAVGIDCWEIAPTMSAPGSGKSWLATEHRQGPTPDFEIIVPTSSAPIELAIDIPKRP